MFIVCVSVYKLGLVVYLVNGPQSNQPFKAENPHNNDKNTGYTQVIF